MCIHIFLTLRSACLLIDLQNLCGATCNFSDKWQSFVPDLYGCYLLALKEYTIDSRGDIGAWVREAAMIGLHVCILYRKMNFMFVRNLILTRELID